MSHMDPDNLVPFTPVAPETQLYILTESERRVVARALDVIKAVLDDDEATATLTALRDRFAVAGQDFA